jgi:hypothetical protein
MLEHRPVNWSASPSRGSFAPTLVISPAKAVSPKRTSGPGRLPMWVVRKRLNPYAMGSSSELPQRKVYCYRATGSDEAIPSWSEE